MRTRPAQAPSAPTNCNLTAYMAANLQLVILE
jgi:hypothetical protein